jgi:hypothetical protein
MLYRLEYFVGKNMVVILNRDKSYLENKIKELTM